MLQENKIGKTISLKLISGDEVVGKVAGQTPDGFMLSKPVILAASREGLAMVPFMMTGNPNAEYFFKSDNVVCVVETNRDISDAYLQTTTGIQPVRNQSGLIVN